MLTLYFARISQPVLPLSATNTNINKMLILTLIPITTSSTDSNNTEIPTLALIRTLITGTDNDIDPRVRFGEVVCGKTETGTSVLS